VNVRKFPLELCVTGLGDSVIVPTPSPAVTVTCGDPALKLVSVPPELDFSCVVKVYGVGPPEDGAVAPGPPVVSPYVTVHVAALATLTPVT
jgi:hypothetical protein